MGEDGIEVFVHEFFVGCVDGHDDPPVLVFILDGFAALVPDFEHECFVLVLSQFVLVSEDAFDDFAVKSLVSADTFLNIHDDFTVGFLEGFILMCISDGSVRFGPGGEIRVGSIGKCAET